MPRSLGDGKSEGGSKPSTLEVCPPRLEWLHTPVHFHRMSEHETKENDATSMPREEYFKAFLEGVDFWHDLPVLFRLMEEKYLNRTTRTAWADLAAKKKSKLRTLITKAFNITSRKFEGVHAGLRSTQYVPRTCC